MYIHQFKIWPAFTWDHEQVGEHLPAVRYHQGKLVGRMEALGFQLREEATLQTLTQEVVKSSEVEGEILDQAQVRSSLARRLGIELEETIHSERSVEGIVEMMVDATRRSEKPLTEERLFGWHAALFPTGRNGMNRITVGAWRTGRRGPMQVVSGPIGKETIHFEAPEAERVPKEMKLFLSWFNETHGVDPVVKAAIAHFWFVTIHPFEDGNGRIGRAIAEMQLARADENSWRFYSMSAQIRKERTAYYEILEATQKNSGDITSWLMWFLQCLERTFTGTETILANVLLKASFWNKHGGLELNGRQRKIVNRMLDGIEGNMTSTKWARMAKCSKETAIRDIQDLIGKGLMLKVDAGGRSTNYVLRQPESDAG